MNEEERNTRTSNLLYINIIVLLFSSCLIFVDVIEWKRLISAWRFSVNHSPTLFYNCYEKDLDYRTVSLFFSTLTDLLVFYFFFIMLCWRGENKIKPIKIGFSLTFFWYGLVLLSISAYTLFKWKDYIVK